ncbi:7-deoxyloganetic acid glucosyltransferase-like [Dendrobium catenatum]|uniref:7-deoxyloganetic acid glucosyltransferase-like n=1 Tax=Dendrobium catenatum TaxID=906689 RepID=UPI00109FC14E|nr:7-deoxyloganetic acid glucosyltransferase-like [Dendrobium catenatum]
MEVAKENLRQEAHLLIFPAPLQGHINAMLPLADALSSSAAFASASSTQTTTTASSASSPLHNTPASLSGPICASSPFLTASPTTNLARRTTQALGIPVLAFRTISASSLWVYLQIPQMIEAGELPFPADADLDEHIKSVPAMEGFLRCRDLPSMCRKATKADDKELQLFTNFAACAPILSQIASFFPTIYVVGPLNALVESITSSSVSASLLAEDRYALSWLDAQPYRSIVYVSFGSLARLTQEEFLEFWHGFVNSGHRFLWVVQPNFVAEGTTSVEMAGLEQRVRLVAWAPQEEVLRHRAVGCFITHSGWNSTLESAAAGVPMVCWPCAWDQLVNSRLVGEVWKVGLDMKDVCKREMVESMVRAAMEEDKAEELRRKATDLAVEIGRSMGEGGDARLDFERLLKDILSLSLCASIAQ